MTINRRLLAAILACTLMILNLSPALAESRTVYTARDNATVYDASGAAIGTLPIHTKLRLTGVKGDICKVKRDGKTAYMMKSDLTDRKTDDSAESAETSTDVTVYVIHDGATIYNRDGDAIGKSPLNTRLTCNGVKGDICRVEAGGKTAYMMKSDLSRKMAGTVQPTSSPTAEAEQSVRRTVYVAKDGAKVYNAKGKALGTLSANTVLTLTGTKGDICRVEADGRTGYMYSSDLSTEKQNDYLLRTGDSGEDVKKVQQRLKALGYFAGSVDGDYQSMTKAAVEAFQTQAGLSADGDCGLKTLEALFSDDAPKMPRTAELSAATSDGPTASGSSATPARGTAKAMDWWTSDIQKIFARGVTATITDVETGLAWREQRRGGTNHADVQPLTAADTAVLKKVYGGTWSWKRRAIFVTINGVNYAASMNGMPHGGGSISGNNFNGHHCIHFTNSRTHGSNKVCDLHQAAIQTAARADLG